MNASMKERPSRRLIIPIFIAGNGCPHRCVFCRGASGGTDGPEIIPASIIEDTVRRYLSTAKPDRKDSVQIAFYGGNFTGLNIRTQESLLNLAGTFIERGVVHSLRVSTRPDGVDPGQIEILKKGRVKTVEIGAQSMVEEVLKLSGRGHSAEDVRRAVTSLRAGGFETGVHLMAGLPGDSRKHFLFSVEEIIRLKPDMVRIHPTIVFSNTALADAYISGRYRPLTIDEAVDICGEALTRFENAGIPVIRIGLQPDSDMERPGTVLGGPYHPAFRSLVEEKLFFETAMLLLARLPEDYAEVIFHVSPGDISFFRGLRNGNLQKIKERVNQVPVTVLADPAQKRGSLTLSSGGRLSRIERSVRSAGKLNPARVNEDV